MSRITAEQHEALRHIPPVPGGPKLNERVVEELIDLGLVEIKLGGLGLTRRGQTERSLGTPR